MPNSGRETASRAEGRAAVTLTVSERNRPGCHDQGLVKEVLGFWIDGRRLPLGQVVEDVRFPVPHQGHERQQWVAVTTVPRWGRGGDGSRPHQG
jgi:hypothetical protein